jgi:predicted short-subunit dehydrogenase-like oxidoreductase (DUF2520 family)
LARVNRPTKPSIAIVGAGNLARALAPALRHSGYEIREVIARDTTESRRRAGAVARSAGARARARTLAGAALDADVIWLCVADAAIAEVGRSLAPRTKWRGKVALHSSGALTSDELAALRRRGASVGSLHPMMTFVSRISPSLHGVPFAVEGDAKAAAMARQIASDLGGETFALRKRQKTLYHALGSFSSPLLVMLLAQAEQVGRAAGLTEAQTKKAMRGIVEQTLANYFAGGAAAAFSGPIRRGDLVTVKRHLKELGKVPGALEIYRRLAGAAVRNLPVGRRAEMKRLLEGR